MPALDPADTDREADDPRSRACVHQQVARRGDREAGGGPAPTGERAQPAARRRVEHPDPAGGVVRDIEPGAGRGRRAGPLRGARQRRERRAPCVEPEHRRGVAVGDVDDVGAATVRAGVPVPPPDREGTRVARRRPDRLLGAAEVLVERAPPQPEHASARGVEHVQPGRPDREPDRLRRAGRPHHLGELQARTEQAQHRAGARVGHQDVPADGEQGARLAGPGTSRPFGRAAAQPHLPPRGAQAVEHDQAVAVAREHLVLAADGEPGRPHVP